MGFLLGGSFPRSQEYPVIIDSELQNRSNTHAQCIATHTHTHIILDPNDPVVFEDLNTDYFTRDRTLFHSLDHQRWYPVLHLNTRLYSKKIKDALDLSTLGTIHHS